MILLLALALFSVSTSSIFARYLPAVPAVVIAFWRMAIAGGLLWGYSFVLRQGTITRRNARKTALAGFLLALHFACFFGALKLTTVAHATVLATMAPVFTALIERFYLRRPWNRAIGAGLLLALVGAVVIQGGSVAVTRSNQIGNGLALLSALWMAIVLLVAEHIRQDTGTVVYSRLVYAVAGGTLLVLAVALGLPVTDFTARDFGWLFLLGLIPTVIGHTTFSYAVKYVRPTIVAAVPLGEPVVASALAWVLLGEVVRGSVMVGGALVLFGLYLITSRQAVQEFQIDTL
jgi:drug/metabolite transporter (DMT)-like permease